MRAFGILIVSFHSKYQHTGFEQNLFVHQVRVSHSDVHKIPHMDNDGCTLACVYVIYCFTVDKVGLK